MAPDEETVQEVALRKTADQFKLTDEERQDERLANLVRGTFAYAFYDLGESLRRFGAAMREATNRDPG